MKWKRIAVWAAAVFTIALAGAPPADAGFWGDLKRSFGTAVDNAEREGAEAAEAVGEAAGDAAGYVAGDTENAAAEPVEAPVESLAEPAADEPKQLSKKTSK